MERRNMIKRRLFLPSGMKKREEEETNEESQSMIDYISIFFSEEHEMRE